MPTKEIDAHWKRLRNMGCLITGRKPPTIHHCHSGSMGDVGVHRGWGRKVSDWLTIPIDEIYHTGEYGIDSGFGVLSWEKEFGTQVEMLDEVCLRLDFNVWVRAGFPRDIVGQQCERGFSL